MTSKSSPLHGTSDEESRQRWFFDCGQQWTEWLGRMNWYNFTLARLDIEWDKMTGRWVLDIALVGFYAQLTYLYDDSFNREMVGMKDQITAALQAEHPGCTVSDPLGALAELDRRSEGKSE